MSATHYFNMIKEFLTLLLIIIGINQIFLYPLPVKADDAKTIFHQNLNLTAEKIGYQEGVPGAAKLTLPYKIGQIINIALTFLGVIFLLLIIYGGFTWMTAGGNEQKITKAKGTIFNAAIGLIVVLAAYAITAYFGEAIGNALIK